MKARIIQVVDGQAIATEVDADNVIAAMEVRGYPFTKLNASKHGRSELQGLPKFAGVAGPMWDGDAVRYETTEAYALMSA